MTELQEKAIKKIEDGCRNYKGSKHGSAVVRPVADTLEQFCESNADFAAAVLGEDKHFADCIAAVTHGVGAAISDIEASFPAWWTSRWKRWRISLPPIRETPAR